MESAQGYRGQGEGGLLHYPHWPFLVLKIEQQGPDYLARFGLFNIEQTAI